MMARAVEKVMSVLPPLCFNSENTHRILFKLVLGSAQNDVGLIKFWFV